MIKNLILIGVFFLSSLSFAGNDTAVSELATSQNGEKVVIYVFPTCPYCIKAKALLEEKNISYKVIDITNDSKLTNKLVKATGQKTVPYIFVNGAFIGGCDNLIELNKDHKLDHLSNK